MINVGNTTENVPTFGLRHRLALALEAAEVSVAAMADELGVSRNTVGNYLAGRTTPPRPTLRVWALRCGVPFEWLWTGEVPQTPPDGPNGTVTRRYQATLQLAA